MKKTLFAILASAIVLMSLLMTGCSATQVTTTISLVVTSAQATFPLVAQEAKLDSTTTTQINGYLTGLQACVVQVNVIEAGTDTNAVKAAKIVAAFAAVTKPNLPPGTPQTVAAIVDTVATAAEAFLVQFQPTSVTTLKLVSTLPSVDSPITFKIANNDFKYLPASIKAKFAKK